MLGQRGDSMRPIKQRRKRVESPRRVLGLADMRSASLQTSIEKLS